jgi:putative ABC transport system substrate-binding protein
MHRRLFLTLLGGAAAGWPLAARAQQRERVRRVGMLMAGSVNDPAFQTYAAVVREALAKLGWVEGLNLRIDLRFGEGDDNRFRAYAAELVQLAPDAILTSGNATGRTLQEATRIIPIVVAAAGAQESPNPLVHNIAHPEGNITAFTGGFASIAGKLLELLKEAAPTITRVAVVFNPNTQSLAPGIRASIDAAAPVLAIKTIDMPVHNAAELERAIEDFATEPNGSVAVPRAGTNTRDIRQSLHLIATKHRLPTIHFDRNYPTEGGLMSYGTDIGDLHRRAAGYVDRLLRGAKVSELPVQYPTKFNLVVNLKAARAIDLMIPESFLVRADEVIE